MRPLVYLYLLQATCLENLWVSGSVHLFSHQDVIPHGICPDPRLLRYVSDLPPHLPNSITEFKVSKYNQQQRRLHVKYIAVWESYFWIPLNVDTNNVLYRIFNYSVVDCISIHPFSHHFLKIIYDCMIIFILQKLFFHWRRLSLDIYL